jgi:hydrogenase maturation protease
MARRRWFPAKSTLARVASIISMSGNVNPPRRVFIGGIGYPFLRDMSVGPVYVPQLKKQAWQSGVEIDDLNVGGPIAAVHRFRELPPYERVIIFGAMRREREIGGIYCYRWDEGLPDLLDIQDRVAEAVTGVISLDNLLIIGGYFTIWPPQGVVVIEIEPRDEEWGEEFSPPVQAAVAHLRDVLDWALNQPLDTLPTNVTNRWRMTDGGS